MPEDYLDILSESAWSQARDSGIDSDDPVFSHYAMQAPSHTPEGEHVDFYNQVSWAVDKTRRPYET